MAAALLTGCKDSRRRPPPEWKAVPAPVTVNGVVLDQKAEPSAVATAMLDLLKQCRDVRSKGLADPQRAAQFDTIRDQIHRLAAAERIFADASKDPHRLMPSDLTAEKAVEIVTNDWPAVVGYYVDGMSRESVFQQTDDETHAQVAVRAVSPHDREVMERITRSLSDQRSPRGEPLKPGSDAYNAELKRQALAEGVCPPIDTRIGIFLVKESGYWRVAGIRLDRTGTTAKLTPRSPAPPTTNPAAKSS